LVGQKKIVLLNNAQNVSMLIRWHYDCPKLKGFYFEMSCERLFGYLSCIGTKDRKTHNVMKTLINFLVFGANIETKAILCLCDYIAHSWFINYFIEM